MVLVPLDPCVMFKLLGDELIEKTPTGAPQPANLNEAMRVFQLNATLLGMYSFVYQSVQSSDGSTLMKLESPQRERLEPVCEPAPLITVPSPWSITPAGRLHV